MRFNTLSDWLHWQETLHPKTIDLGLERAGEVLQRMGLTRPSHAVITVAGTNGKGSSVAYLESILRAAGYRVGAFTSPHLLRYNERIRIDGAEVGDEALCAAFERVDQARGGISLSYFEFGTLAAFDLFERAGLDAAVLEVGLGGRLDAVNLLDADVTLVATIDLDHTDWLGPDRDSIAREKAGIFRAGRSAVCSDPEAPAALAEEAERIGARLYRTGEDFLFGIKAGQWWWRGLKQRRDGLPLPALRGVSQVQNAAGALMVLELLTARIPVYQEDVRRGLAEVRLTGRFQVQPGEPTLIFDVAHNPEAARELAANLARFPNQGRTLAVCAMLATKDIAAVIKAVRGEIEQWFVAGLEGWPRSASAEYLAEVLAAEGVAALATCATVPQALAAARSSARPGDRIVVFGSFHTVATALEGSV